MQNRTDDFLGLTISLTASPAVNVEKGSPAAMPPAGEGTFLLHAEVALHYASFGRVLNDVLAGKRIVLSEGLFAKHVDIRNIAVTGTQSNAILLTVQFTGSFNGAATFSAIPVYNEETAAIVLLHLRYDLQTNNLLLKGARLLFASRIEKELKKMSRIPVGPLLDQLQQKITESLNREWNKGIRGSGDAKDLRLQRIEALPEHLLLQLSCKGSLQITIGSEALHFKR